MSKAAIMREEGPTKVIRERYAMATPEELLLWANKWGVSRETIRRRASELRIKRCNEAARLSLSEGTSARYSKAIAYSPPVLDRDEDYIAACLAQGGFGRFADVHGRKVWVSPSRHVVAQR